MSTLTAILIVTTLASVLWALIMHGFNQRLVSEKAELKNNLKKF
jgi:hypothetical protein